MIPRECNYCGEKDLFVDRIKQLLFKNGRREEVFDRRCVCGNLIWGKSKGMDED